jgi:hypothetical protein
VELYQDLFQRLAEEELKPERKEEEKMSICLDFITIKVILTALNIANAYCKYFQSLFDRKTSPCKT